MIKMQFLAMKIDASVEGVNVRVLNVITFGPKCNNIWS